MGVDRIQDACRLFEHVRVPEPQDSIALCGKPTVALLIVLSLRSKAVLSAIDLDHKLGLVTKEVSDVGTYRNLAAKM
jgi:hypothetical protein